MTKKVLSREEHQKQEEQRKRPMKLEIVDIDNDYVSIKSPIPLHKDRYALLNKICDITGEHIQEYIKDAYLIPKWFDNKTCLDVQNEFKEFADTYGN